ncbi:MAG: hypothetical protein ACP5MD_11210, partial [Verrucomicrobiia bacterium]
RILRGSSADFGNCGSEQGTICPPPHNQGAKPKLRACHFIRLTPDGSAVVTTLPAAREADTQELTKLAA